MSDEQQTEDKVQADQNDVPMEATMKCIVLTGFGGTKMLRSATKPVPSPKEGEVSIRVRACGLSFQDIMVCQGAIDNAPKTPLVLGFECSGEVDAVGKNVSGFDIGDHVIGFTEYHAWAEVVTIPSQFVYRMPPGMSFQDGAALPMSYMAAYIMLFELGNLRSGQSVLVHSVGGSLGHAVSQLCKTVDNVTVFGTASYNKHESIKGMIEHLYDHDIDYSQEVKKSSPEGVNIVLDCLCGEDANRGIGLLKPMGKYVLYGSSNIVSGETKSFFSLAKSWWQVDRVSPIKLYEENKSIAGFQLRQLAFRQGQHAYLRRVMETLFTFYTEGKIRPRIDSTWAFEDISEAFQKMHNRENVGKILLDPALAGKNSNDDTAKLENTNGTTGQASD